MFNVDEEQRKKLSAWMKEQDKAVAKKQGRAEPYYGANGGAYTYKFTPTSLGMILQVVSEYTHQTIDLTDYNSW